MTDDRLELPAWVEPDVERLRSALRDSAPSNRPPNTGPANTGPPSDVEVIDALVGLGSNYHAGSSGHRERGAVYTPWTVATELVAIVDPAADSLVCDPAVGCGVFLLAAAEHRFRAGGDPVEIVASSYGADLDPGAVAVSRAVMELWRTWRTGGQVADVGTSDRLIVGDATLMTPAGWPAEFDVVIGNPPYLGQLRSDTARSASRTASLRDRWGAHITAYLDESAVFMLTAAGLAPAGRVCLLVPRSVLAVDGAAAVRATLQEQLGLSGLWVGGSEVFADAAVDVVAVVLGDPSTEVTIHDGSAVRVVRPHGADWFRLVEETPSAAEGRLTSGSLGDVAQVAADFRDAYYWLADRVVEADGGQTDTLPSGLHPIVTVGAIDPLHLRWGTMPTRFAKQRFAAPAARLEEHPPAEVERWVGRRAQPKVLVATQTKVVECVVDEAGTYLPSTPCLTVIPTAGASLWDLAAALTSPVMAAWARGEAGGTGLSRETFRLRAKQLQGAPLPGDRATWAVGAALAEELHRAGTPSSAPIGAFRELGQVMNAAYGITDEPLLDWWLELLPRR